MDLSKRMLELKNRISKIFLTVSNEDFYNEVLTVIREEFESQFGYFGYLALNGDLVCPSMTKDIWDRCQVHQKDFVFPREKWEKKDTIWGRSIAENKLLVSNSPRNVPKGHLAIKKILVAPITFHEEVIGQIALANKPGGYKDDDIKLMEEITDFIAPIFNARREKAREISLRQKAEKLLRESQQKLRERVKELRCLYDITQLTEQKEVSIEKVLKGIIELIPPAFKHPDLISALISFDEKKYKTKNFIPSEFKLSSQIRVNDSYLNIEVFYKIHREFLPEENDLIIEISNKLKFIIERILSEKKMKESEEKIRKAYDRAGFYKDLFAHDINNILNNVKSSVELLNSMYKNNNFERFENIFEILQEQVIRGSNLVNNIRNLSEIEDAEKIIETIDLNKIVKESIHFVKKSVDKDNLKINFHSEIDNPFVKANKLLLDVFENILFNAIEYNQSRLKIIDINISESKSEEKGYFRVEFRDNGIGIPPELKNRLFKEKIDYERKTKGMGLGLLTVHKILTSYGGKIWVENRIQGSREEGSNMVILLPKA